MSPESLDKDQFTKEAVNILRRIGRGKVKVVLDGADWHSVHAGNVCFKVEGWEIVIFNDCDSFDYMDHMIAPDGRSMEFEDWCPEETGYVGPENLLYAESPALFHRMAKEFETAR